MSVSDKWWFFHENKAAFPLIGVQPCFYVFLIIQSKLEFLILVFLKWNQFSLKAMIRVKALSR